jgi:hypothetical protein
MSTGQFDHVLLEKTLTSPAVEPIEQSRIVVRRAQRALLKDAEELQRDMERLKQGQALLRRLGEITTNPSAK